MKILVISDIHLNDKFEQKKFEFLKKIVSQVDKVIINGDFWDGYITDFSSFVNSQWKQLFPLLKSKKTVYVYGNHDKKKYADSRVSLFSDTQTYKYEFKNNKFKLIFEHGNRIEPSLDDKLKIKVPSLIIRILHWGEHFMIKRFGNKFLSFAFQKHNDDIKKIIKRFEFSNAYYFYGHTHKVEIDEDNRFINSGIIKGGLGQYILIQNDKFEIKEEWYDF